MKPLEMIPTIKELCAQRKYEQARDLALQIPIAHISIKAYLLCCEHEQSYLKTTEKAP